MIASRYARATERVSTGMAGGVPRGDGRGDRGSGAGAAARAGTRPETVTGAVDPADLGTTLMHDTCSWTSLAPRRSARRATTRTPCSRGRCRPQGEARGCATLVECTPAYLGRDPRLLRRLSEASGLHILTNTGYYGANKDKHLPPHAFTETAEQLAARWIRE